MHKLFLSLASRFALSRAVAVALAALAVASGAATYIMLTRRPDDFDTIYMLLNADLVLLLLLGAVVGRQMAKVWSEQRRGIAGSRLQARMVMIFSLLAAAPAIMMAVFSSLFLYFGMQAWFNDRVSTAVKESLEVARAYLNEHQQVMRADVLAMANDLNRSAAFLADAPSALSQAVETQAQLRNLSEAIVFNSDGEIMASGRLSFSLQLDALAQPVLNKAMDGEVVLLAGDANDRIRALVKLDRFFDAYLYVGRMVDADVLTHMRNTETAVQQYATLEGRSSKLQILMTVMFMLVALLLMMGAMWMGLIFARRLVAPISALIGAAERARTGDLSVRVPARPDGDEIDILAGAFNRMTGQIEAVLSGASSGVIALDREGFVVLTNTRALEILEQESLIGRRLVAILPALEDKTEENDSQIQVEHVLPSGIKRTLMVHVTAQKGGAAEGAVVTIDDITALVSAQRKAVWSDVARRIAHEIKNPLTPIQLSAERLRRKYLPQIKDDPETFEKCVETIVRQVGDIGHMVSEFSTFARMPVPVKKEENVGLLCEEALVLQRHANPDIVFDFHAGERLNAMIDRSQFNQVLTNLLQNAIDSIREGGKEQGRVRVSVARSGPNAVVTVADNGQGLPEKGREQLLDPYVTTRKKGTGLGLAIVKKILEDHEGSVSLEDNDGGGAKAVIVFPAMTARATGERAA